MKEKKFTCAYCSGTGYEDYPESKNAVSLFEIPCRIVGHKEQGDWNHKCVVWKAWGDAYNGKQDISMKIDQDADEFVFSSGRREYANGCIIGINKDSDGTIQVYGGYDQGFGNCDPLTKDERIELADYAIAMWIEYKGGSK